MRWGVIIGTVAIAVSAALAAVRPNIIFILADDLAYADLGCYGQKQIRTPHIDRLAAEGMRFTQFYAGSTVCAPSRSCLMTGQHTGHTRIRGNGGRKGERVALHPQDVTVAEVLKEAGYRTGIFGKWGLGEDGSPGVPNRQGFDEWYGFLNQTDAHNYYPPFLHRNEKKITLPGNADGRREQYVHDLFTQEALAFIERSRGGPFFLYLAYTIPHANNELTRETGNGMEVPSDAPYTDKQWAQPDKNFAAMVTRMDGDVGKIMAKLKELALDEKTIVFFTSDNGPHKEGGRQVDFFDSNGPLRGIKRDLYEGGIRVPMIVRGPGRVLTGVSDHVGASWDFLPTAAELAGAAPPEGIDGLSMLNALRGRPQKSHEYLYWEFHEAKAAQAVRFGDWKAVRPKGKPIELYDLAKDLGEERDVASQHPEVVARAENILSRARTESEPWPWP